MSDSSVNKSPPPTLFVRQETVVYERGRDPFELLYSSNEIEIGMVVGGSGIHRILNRDIPCVAGDIYITNANIPHAYFASGEDESLMLRRMFFSPTSLFEEDISNPQSPRFCYGVFSENAITAYARLTQRTSERISALYDAIMIESLEKKSEWQNAVRSHLSLMLITLGRYVNRAIKSIPRVELSEWSPVSAAMLAIRENYSDCELTLENIADSIFVSKSHLSRLFVNVTGESFSDHLRRTRMERACELLRSTPLTVEDIMRECGLRDATSFYKVFNSYVGMTPSAYRKTYKKENTMSIFVEISENLQKGKSKAVKELVQKALDDGISAKEILDCGLVAGMSVVGEKFKNNEIYVPEVLVAARAMNMGAQILKPHLATSGVVAKGKVCLGTVQGDLHDIGKNLVKMMMEGKGLEVIDLGTDVAPEAFVQAAIDNDCQLICCSALLTTTMDAMADVVKAADAAGVRDKIKIMIGGAPVSDEFCRQIGADCYTPDAASAADAAEAFCRA